jgi:hypothetical protein
MTDDSYLRGPSLYSLLVGEVFVRHLVGRCHFQSSFKHDVVLDSKTQFCVFLGWDEIILLWNCDSWLVHWTSSTSQMEKTGELMELCKEGKVQVLGNKPVSVSHCTQKILNWRSRKYGMIQDEIPEIVSRKTCSQLFLLPDNYNNFISVQMLCPLRIDSVIYPNSLFDH